MQSQMKGFVTLAVGDLKYYRLARNLLMSYKMQSKTPLPFAIVADRENDITKLFDKVIILNNPTFSYIDKIHMLNVAPFDENIFIDADCLAYKDLNEYWNLFSNVGGVRCFGHKLSLGSCGGWFDIDNIGVYKDQVKFEVQMHGGIIYFAKDVLTKSIYTTAIEIANNYSSYKFKYFNQPADEPVLALAMAINNCPPMEWGAMGYRAYLFLPVADKYHCNILKQELRYKKENKWISGVSLMHWQNINTETSIYWREVERIKTGKDVPNFIYALVKMGFYCKKQFKRLKRLVKK